MEIGQQCTDGFSLNKTFLLLFYLINYNYY